MGSSEVTRGIATRSAPVSSRRYGRTTILRCGEAACRSQARGISSSGSTSKSTFSRPALASSRSVRYASRLTPGGVIRFAWPRIDRILLRTEAEEMMA